MKVSYRQLQTYFIDPLPTPEKLAEEVTFHVFEIEGMEKSGDDTILDIKVLPDRAGYAKSVDGIAREVSAITGLKRKVGMAVAPAFRVDKIIVKVADINEALGADISTDEMKSILERMDIGVEIKADKSSKNAELILSIPSDRTDLQNWRDIPEEIGRMYGYDKIKAVLPRNDKSRKPFTPAIEKTFYYSEKIRNILVEAGFSEIYGYSLTAKGDYEIEKSVATDKNYLRTNAAEGVAKALDINSKNADLLALDDIRIFEIGKIFPASGERTSLVVGIKNTKKKDEKPVDKLKKAVDAISASLGQPLPFFGFIYTNKVDADVYETNLDQYIAGLPEPKSYADLNLGKAVSTEYKKFSLQPFIRRDIAVWVPQGIEEGAVKEIITDSLHQNSQTDASELTAKIIGNRAFDTFSKAGKTSYAFGITFQSFDRTLTDAETNAIMEKVYETVKAKGWEVR